MDTSVQPVQTTIRRGPNRHQALIGNLLVAAIFAALWLLNGIFTVQALMFLGLTSVWWAWSIHLGVSLLEGAAAHVLGSYRRVQVGGSVIVAVGVVLLIIGVADIGSTAWGFHRWLQQFSLPLSTAWQIGLTLFVAFFIALTPEPVLLATWKATRSIRRRG